MSNCEDCAKAKVCKFKEDFKLIAKQAENMIPIGSIITATIKCGEWVGIVSTGRLIDFSQRL